MRKLSIGLISIVLCFCLFMFVGCDNNKSSVEEESVSYYCSYSQLEKMEIGSELPIYPECEFDYKLTYKDKDYIIHITSLSAQLVKKNFIEKDALIEGEYYPFEVHAVVEGSVPTNFPLKSFAFLLGCQLYEFM